MKDYSESKNKNKLNCMVIHDHIDSKFENFYYTTAFLLKENKKNQLDNDYRVFGVFSVLESILSSSYTMRKMDINQITDWYA